MLLTTVPKGRNYIHRIMTTMKPPFTKEVNLRMMILLFVRHDPQREEVVIEAIQEVTKGEFSEEKIEEAIDKAMEEGYLKEWDYKGNGNMVRRS